LILGHLPPPVDLGPGEWFMVGLATAIIFAILGPRLWRDLSRGP
jgi:hypothetical protein